ncbi:hypothetical protein AHMF7605_29000 [Adhaeribacter arboris]|uniref:Polyketide cyclase n=1 Tax=Adhaeribacter arboris TaxID=2072846 RepID=A0A2T2Y8V5_9BACT|nr:SRPBCC family protein [Adhaeribacter arboris]PSR51950.1 hypothetical protein AHMF7605_29000 [Adhaeribacter arboris]
MEFTLTKTINIKANPDQVWNYVSDLSQWPQWAIHNVQDAQKGENGYWFLAGPRGVSKVRMNANQALGILDHEFLDPAEGHWLVPCRVVVGHEGAHFLITFTKPDPMPSADFEKGMELVNEELIQLKDILEK